MGNEERFGFIERVRPEPFRLDTEKKSLKERGIIVRSASQVILAEEADPAYKDVDRVVEISDKIGIATRVARLAPMAVIKG